jgi:hypothetical protein
LNYRQKNMKEVKADEDEGVDFMAVGSGAV